MKKIYTNNSSSFNGQKMGALWESDGTLMGVLANEHESNMNRTSIEHRSNMNGRRMGEMKYFARVAAVLLMLITMSVGEGAIL